VHTGFGRERAHFINLGTLGGQILKWILKRSAVRVWLKIQAGGRHL